VALPAQQVNITNGMPQATAALVAGLGHAALRPLAAIVAALLVVGNVGGVGAWLAGSARLPFAAGVDRALPAVFGRVHPRWQTPYVALLVQGVLATAFVVAGLAGATVRDAYVALTSTTIILFFLPYLYIFAAYLRLRRQRTIRTAIVGWVGLAAVTLSIALSLVPPAVEHPWVFEAKVLGGTAVFLAIGMWLAPRPAATS
jgi:amino acid transporter